MVCNAERYFRSAFYVHRSLGDADFGCGRELSLVGAACDPRSEGARGTSKRKSAASFVSSCPAIDQNRGFEEGSSEVRYRIDPEFPGVRIDGPSPYSERPLQTVRKQRRPDFEQHPRQEQRVGQVRVLFHGYINRFIAQSCG
jgi:hypothetical protein